MMTKHHSTMHVVGTPSARGFVPRMDRPGFATVELSGEMDATLRNEHHDPLANIRADGTLTVFLSLEQVDALLEQLAALRTEAAA